MNELTPTAQLIEWIFVGHLHKDAYFILSFDEEMHKKFLSWFPRCRVTRPESRNDAANWWYTRQVILHFIDTIEDAEERECLRQRLVESAVYVHAVGGK